MRYDKLNLFSNAQAVTASAASTSSIDASAARDLGNGEPVYVVVCLVVAMTDAGSNSTCVVTVQTDSDTAFGSATDAQRVGSFAAASAAGSRLAVPLQIDKINEQYIRLYYDTSAGGDLTTGSFTSFLTYDVQGWVAYADAVEIQ